MIYRNAIINDLPEIVAIYNSTVAGRLVTADTEPVTIEDKIDWFKKHEPSTRPLWIVEDNSKTIGWVSFNSFYGRPAYNGTVELSIYLHPAARGRGYGKKILKYCIEQASFLGIHTILGFIFSHNKPSIVLFEQAGFKEWGLLPDVAIMDEKKYSLSIYGLKI
ncbi:MAG: N-acetyltransferase family protein [Sphingobacteriales bacterium]|nr:MAG: N-acetyltransferase family protein [Sphingobacteriales bacterium]